MPAGKIEKFLASIILHGRESDNPSLANNATEVLIFVAGVRLRPALLEVIEGNEILTKDDYVAAKLEMREMLDVLIEQIWKTPSVTDETMKFYEKYAQNMLILTGASNENRHFNFTKLYETLENYLKVLLEKAHQQFFFADDEHLFVFQQLNDHLTLWRYFNPNFFDSIMMGDSFNAFANPSMETLMITEAPLIIGKGTTLAARYGGVGGVYGHEMMHDVIQEYGSDTDKKVKENHDCLIGFAQQVCGEYVDEEWKHEEECIPVKRGKICSCKAAFSMATFFEFVADQEGMQLAFLALQKRLSETEMKKPTYPTIPSLKHISNEQLFFYAYAASYCETDEDSQYTAEDEHPAAYVRINTALSLSNAFMKSFNCSKDSRMFKLQKMKETRCNQIGEPVRRKMKTWSN
ncbi:unnamed protein product, partial [Mesorhabditis belari]|uniref:Peptidase M13 C-terminal domain-containing protein n=1 Tax=Mesorhabditis belari TaxID=2138241 RepID=A0AAF3EL06_9BILA